MPAGQPNQPVIPVRGGPFASGSEAAISQILDGSYGAVVGNSLYRSTTGWLSGTTFAPYGFTFSKTGAISVATDVAPWLMVATPFVFSKILLMAKTAPVGAALIVDILYSPDGGANFASIGTGAGYSLPDGSQSTFATISSALLFSIGAVLRLDVLQVGSGTAGSNLTVTAFGNAAQ